MRFAFAMTEPSGPRQDAATMFDVLIALFELDEPGILDRFPEAVQELARAGMLWPEKN